MSEPVMHDSSPEPEEVEYDDLITFSVDALRHVSKDATDVLKYAEVGAKYNMCFKMLKSDSRLVKSVLFSYGFIQCSSKNPNFNVFWTNTHLNAHSLRQLKSWQRINHFPRSFLITKKDELYVNVCRAQAQYGNMFDFIPESFSTPLSVERRTKLKKELDQSGQTGCTFILKPSNSSRGRGILFMSKPEDVDEVQDTDKVIISRYISNPFLVEKKKSDLRVYVTVTSFYPLVAYMYTDGLTRFAVEEYDNDLNGMSTEAQLTNYSLHKGNDKFVKNTATNSESVGHKWTLSAMLRYMKRKNMDTDYVVIKTLLSIQRVVAASCRKLDINPKSCFELFGFDILIDDNLKPWLLEVNLSPSLACDAPLDSIIKTHLICNTLNLACIPLVLKKNAAVSALMGTVNNPVVDELSQLTSHASISGYTSRANSPSTVDSGYDTHSAVSDGQSTITEEKRSTERVEREPPTFHKRRSSKRASMRAAKLRRAQQMIRTPPPPLETESREHSSRLDLLERKLRTEEGRMGDFIRIFPRPESRLLYKKVFEDSGQEQWDALVQERLFGPEPEHSHRDYETCHKELMDAKKYPTTESLSKQTRNLFLKSALKSTPEYLKPFYEHETAPFPAALPKLRPTARRRTRSQLDFDIRRRLEVLEAREKSLNPL